jgi:hypothetical protein
LRDCFFSLRHRKIPKRLGHTDRIKEGILEETMSIVEVLGAMRISYGLIIKRNWG